MTATSGGGSAEQVAVTVLPPEPATVGSIEAATITEGATHMDRLGLLRGRGGDVHGGVLGPGVATVAVEGAAVTVAAVAVGSATVTVTATNAGGSAEQAFAVTVVPPAPAAVGSIEAATLTEGATHMVTASDYFAGEGVTYTAESSDPGVATVAVDGAVVTVTAGAAGSATITVTATNAGGSAEQSFAVTVAAARAGGSRQHRGGDSDRGRYAHGDRLGLLRWRGGDVHGGVLGSWCRHCGGGWLGVTVTAGAAGNATITVTATNAGGSAEQSFAVTVVPPAPSAPTAVGSIAPATITEGATHMVTASDYFEGEGVTYTAESSDAEVATVAVEGAAVTVTAVATGSATVTVTATNAGGSAEQSFAVTVVPPAPPAPTAVDSIEAATLTEGATHMVPASDYFAGEGLTYTAESSDPGVATVGGGWRSGDGDGDRRRQRDGDSDGDERGRERGAVLRRDGRAVPRRRQSAASRRRL